MEYGALGNSYGDGWRVIEYKFDNSVQWERYVENQLWQVPVIPQEASRSRRVLWEMVSKAALR